jgi:hypothetical protein
MLSSSGECAGGRILVPAGPSTPGPHSKLYCRETNFFHAAKLPILAPTPPRRELLSPPEKGNLIYMSDLGQINTPDRARTSSGRAAAEAGQKRSIFVRILMFFPSLLRRRRGGVPDEVTVYSAPPSFCLWILILAGFIGSPIVRAYPQYAGIAGWLYTGVIVFLLITFLYDISTKKLALWIGIFLLLFLSSEYVEHVRNIAILGWVSNYLAELQPKLDPGTATVMSWVLLFPWIGSVLDMLLNRCKRFSPNEIAEFHFGDGNELTDRSGLRFRTKYRDLLETLLTFGGGDLLAVDNHQNVIKRYENIIGLYFKWNALDRVLHQRAALIEDDKDDPASA